MTRPAVYLSPAVYALAVRDAEKLAVSRGLDLDALRAKQDKRMRGKPVDDEDDFDTYHARDVADSDEQARQMEAEHEAAREAREYEVPIGEHSYRVSATTPYGAFKAARALHEQAGRPRPTAKEWRAVRV